MDTSMSYPDSPSLDADDVVYPCKGCGQILEEGRAFELAGYRWHIDCFRCNTCGTQLDSDANLLLLGDGSLICNNCTYSCSACGNKIEDLAILTGDQAYCAGCFRCRNCKKKIENLRYARTTQGMFCMDCHDALMARRRKKTSKSRTKNSSNAMLLDKSLPSLPPNAVNQSAFSPDVDTLSDASTPFELPGSAGEARSELPSPTTRQHPAPAPRQSEYDTGDGFFIPMTFDPNPAPGPSPVRADQKFELDSEPDRRPDSHDYFNLRSSTQSSRPSNHNRVSDLDPPQQERSQSPHITSKEQGWEGSPSEKRDSAARPTRQDSAKGSFRLEEAPRRKKSGSKRHSRSEVHSHEDGRADMKSPTGSTREQTSVSGGDQSPRGSSLTAPSSLIARLSEDGNRRLEAKASSSDLVLPKRGDSLNPTPTTGVPARKEVASVSRTASSSQYNDSAPNTGGAGTPGVRSLSDQRSSDLNGGGVVSPLIDSPQPKNVIEFPPRSKDRPGGSGYLGDASNITSPRGVSATTEAANRHRSKPSTSSLQSEGHHNEPLSPRFRTSDFDDAKPVDPGEPSFLRRVSKSVRHSRSHSDRAERTSKDGKLMKPPPHGMYLSDDRTSPIPSSPDHRDDVGRLRDELQREREKSADLPKMEAALASMRMDLDEERKKAARLEKRKSELEDVVDNKTTIQQMNTELREKRSTMVVLDAQKEIVVRELEVLTEHIAAAKRSKEPIDVGAITSAAARELASSLQTVKDSFRPKIEELTERRIQLSEDVSKLTVQKDKAQEEFRQLSAKNAQLMELNNSLVHQIQHLQQTTGVQQPHGLGIYTQHGKEKMGHASSERERPSVVESTFSGVTLGSEHDPETGATILNAPRVINIRKEQPKKTFNWKKGGNVAKGMTKGLKGAFSSNEPRAGGMREPGQPQLTEGFAYGTMSQNGDLPVHGPPLPRGQHPMDAGRQGFGFFGQQKKGERLQKSNGPMAVQIGGSMNGNYLTEEPVHPSKLFGAELGSRADYERMVIPSIVTRCIQEVELRGMDQEGVYRKSGSSSQTDAIRDDFINTSEADIGESKDIHAVTSCLKQYFRKLPTPLITYSVYDMLLEAAAVPGTDERVEAMRRAINELPSHHRDCLEFLMFHLSRVIEHERENLMTAMNCAVVFAPTIMRPESLAREMTDTAAKNAAVQFMIENTHAVFHE